MEYKARTLTSDPGMDQREALTALQTHPSFKPGSIVASIRRRKNQWVAEVLEPKTAEFPPPKDDGGDEGADEAPEPKKDDGPPSEDGGEGPSGDDGPPSDEGGDKPESKGSTEDAILHTLTQILHALQGGGAPEGMGGPDALGPDLGGPPGPPPPKGGGPGGPPPPGGKAPKGPPPMKPGMTPPGGTPVGAPAFASVQANEVPGAPVPTGAQPGPIGPQAGGVCPQDGNPEPCPVHSGAGGLNQAVASYSGKASTITLTTEGTDLKQAVEEARPVVENYGYQVKQAKHGENGNIHILASRR
jgi:hypothetical protein